MSKPRYAQCLECIEALGWLRQVRQHQPATIDIAVKPQRPPRREGVPLPDGPRPERLGPMPSDKGKGERMSIYIYPEDRATLERIAAGYGLSASGTIAMMLRTHKVISIMLDGAKDRGKEGL